MSKTKEELNELKEELDALKEEINKVNEKIRELTPEELKEVTGGATYRNMFGNCVELIGIR